MEMLTTLGWCCIALEGVAGGGIDRRIVCAEAAVPSWCGAEDECDGVYRDRWRSKAGEELGLLYVESV